jgi:hypothetical protein
MAAHAPRPRSPKPAYCPLWWWILPYHTLVAVFLIIIVVLVVHGYPLALAVGVPATVSTVAVRALVRMTEATRTALPSA